MAEQNDEHISLRLGRATTVTLIFEGPITQEGVQRLTKHLEMMRDTYPSETEVRTEGMQWNKPSVS